MAGALLQILKEMETSLLHDIYEDFVGIEITEDMIHSKTVIVSHLNKLDLQHCELVSSTDLIFIIGLTMSNKFSNHTRFDPFSFFFSRSVNKEEMISILLSSDKHFPPIYVAVVGVLSCRFGMSMT